MSFLNSYTETTYSGYTGMFYRTDKIKFELFLILEGKLICFIHTLYNTRPLFRHVRCNIFFYHQISNTFFNLNHDHVTHDAEKRQVILLRFL